MSQRLQSGTASSKAGGKPKTDVPRPSASLVIINNKDEVLLVQRNPQASAFAGITVFPGGNYDSKQDSSIQMTAIRETFEESGLLIARPLSPSSKMLPESVLDKARHEIHSQKMLFQNFLDENGLEADVGALMPFTEWITPVGAPRRFHTRFFVTFLPDASSTGFESGDKQDRLPKPDGGQEVITARFVHPSIALSEFSAGKIKFLPPQLYILTTIMEIFSSFKDRATQRAKIQQLSQGLFGKMVINPRRIDGQRHGNGSYCLTYEGDETRGGKKGRLHRAMLKASGGITLHRNFDIFTEIEGHLFSTEEQDKAKL